MKFSDVMKSKGFGSGSALTSDQVPEGINNKYFTDARARSSISAIGSLTYNSGTGVLNFTDIVTKVANKTGNVILTKADVGLGNVDNTSDANKAVLSASKLTNTRTITLDGDIIGSSSFNGANDITIPTVLKSSGVIAGTYGSAISVPTLIVNPKGLLTSVTTTTINPTFKIGDGTGATKISVKTSEQLEIVAGNNTSLTYDDTTNKITFNGTGTISTSWTAIAGKPTTLAGFGITDSVYSTTDIDSRITSLTDQVNAVKASYNIVVGKSLLAISGGYNSSDGTTNSKLVQSYSGITESTENQGAISNIYCFAAPGGTSKDYGLFFGNSASATAVATSADIYNVTTTSCFLLNNGALPFDVEVTLYDFGIETYIYGGSSANQLFKFNVADKAFTTLANATIGQSSRQGLSGPTFGYTKSNGNTICYKYSYTTNTYMSSINAWNIITDPAGLCKDSNTGYFIGDAGLSTKIVYDVNTITVGSYNSVNFSNSHTLGTSYYGFMVGGSGSGIAHSNIQKMNFSNETIFTAGTLYTATRSGAACQS